MQVPNPSHQAVRFIQGYASGICGVTYIDGLPPSANHAWVPSFRGRGVKVRSKEYDTYIKRVRIELRGMFHVSESPMALFIGFHSPRFVTQKGKASKTMDLDNRIKTLLDTLHGSGRKDTAAIIPVDDALYWHIEAHKIPSDIEFTEIIVANIPDRIGYKL